MKRLAFLCSLLAAIYLISCVDIGFGPGNSEPLFEAEVVDTEGSPVPGLRVGSINHSDYLDYPEKGSPGPVACPSTTIAFELPVHGLVTLEILNYYGERIRLLVDSQSMDIGPYSPHWDARDDNGLLVISGFYRYHLLVWNNDTLSWSDEKWALVEYAPDPAQTLIGITDSNGVFTTDDTLLFPCLLGAPPSLYIRVEDTLVEVADFYKDTVTITLSDTAQPDKFMYFERALKVGPNYFKLIWDSTKTY